METFIIFLAWLISVALIVAAIVVYVLITNAFANCAQEKGYQRIKYFWICFFFGMIGYVVVAALPDKVLNERLNLILSKTA